MLLFWFWFLKCWDFYWFLWWGWFSCWVGGVGSGCGCVCVVLVIWRLLLLLVWGLVWWRCIGCCSFRWRRCCSDWRFVFISWGCSYDCFSWRLCVVVMIFWFIFWVVFVYFCVDCCCDRVFWRWRGCEGWVLFCCCWSRYFVDCVFRVLFVGLVCGWVFGVCSWVCFV